MHSPAKISTDAGMSASGCGKHLPRSTRTREIIRFLCGGLLNTIFSYAIYLGLLSMISPVAAYTCGFLVGVFSGYAINTLFVFKARWSWKRLAAFPLVHIVNYVCGAGVLWLAVHYLAIDERLAPLISICATLPINFLLSRKIVKR